jgi:predicted  nucleic acid-binding Zn-ribbon protein
VLVSVFGVVIMDMKFYKTPKNNVGLFYKGYCFRRSHVLVNGNIVWRCLHKGCPAVMTTNSERSQVESESDLHKKHDIPPIPTQFINSVETTVSHSCEHPNIKEMSSRKCVTYNAKVIGSRSSLDSITKLRKPFSFNQSSQTEDAILRDKDDLLNRIQQLTENQSALVSEIIDLKKQLDFFRGEDLLLRSDSATQTVDTDPDGNTSTISVTDHNRVLETLSLREKIIGHLNDNNNDLYREVSELENRIDELATEVESKNEIIRILSSDLENCRENIRKVRLDCPDKIKNSFVSPKKFSRLNKSDLNPIFGDRRSSVHIQNRYLPLAGELIESDGISSNVPSQKTSFGALCKRTLTDRSLGFKKLYRQNKNEFKSIDKPVTLKTPIISNSGRKRVLILADSHGRHLIGKFKSLLDRPGIEITAVVKPGAKLEDVLNSAEYMTADFSLNDTVIVLGGTNDIGKYDPFQLTLLRAMDKVKLISSYTNVIISEIFPRYDCDASSDIAVANHLINNQCLQFRRIGHSISVFRPQSVLDRRHFTRHGLHLLRVGKWKLVSAIVLEMKVDSIETSRMDLRGVELREGFGGSFNQDNGSASNCSISSLSERSLITVDEYFCSDVSSFVSWSSSGCGRVVVGGDGVSCQEVINSDDDLDDTRDSQFRTDRPIPVIRLQKRKPFLDCGVGNLTRTC